MIHLIRGLGFLILLPVIGAALAIAAIILFTIGCFYMTVWSYRGAGWAFSKINHRTTIN